MILRLIFCSLFVAASGRECTDKGERLELLLKLTMLHFVFRGVHPGLSMSSVRGRQQENRFQSEINFIFSILYFLTINCKKDVLLSTILKGSFPFNSKERKQLLADLNDRICEETPEEEKVCCLKNVGYFFFKRKI